MLSSTHKTSIGSGTEMAPPLRASTLGFGFSNLLIVLLGAVIIVSLIVVLLFYEGVRYMESYRGVFDFARLMMQPSSPNLQKQDCSPESL
eukprot:scaffold20393_cov127-Skeletonema_dohrnii-CCMP3373.AAC.1